MTDIQNDKEIIEAATDGPWELDKPNYLYEGHIPINAPSHGAFASIVWQMEDDRADCAASQKLEATAKYLANFDPIKMREYIAIAEREAVQAERIKELEASLCEAAVSLVDADNLAKVIDEQVRANNIDARSAIADARLDYGEPHNYKRLQLLAKPKPPEGR